MRLFRGTTRPRGVRAENARADWPTRIAGIVLVLVLSSVQVWDPPLVEAARLRKAVADLTLEKLILKEAAAGNW